MSEPALSASDLLGFVAACGLCGNITTRFSGICTGCSNPDLPRFPTLDAAEVDLIV